MTVQTDLLSSAAGPLGILLILVWVLGGAVEVIVVALVVLVTAFCAAMIRQQHYVMLTLSLEH